MQTQSRSPAPDPFSYRQVPVYPEDFKPPCIGNLSAPPSRSTTQANGTGEPSTVRPINTIPAAVEKQGEIPPLQAGSWHAPLQGVLVPNARFADVDMQTCLPYSNGVPFGSDVSHFQSWPNTWDFVNVPHSTFANATELNISNVGAFHHSLPGNHTSSNAFSFADNTLNYNRPYPSGMSMYKPFSAGSMDTLAATSPVDVFDSKQLLWTGAPPAIMQNFEPFSCIPPNQDYSLSSGSSTTFDVHDKFNYARSSNKPTRSFSIASDATVTASFDSGATPLALVAPLSDIESCLLGEVALPPCEDSDDLVADLVNEPKDARAPLQESHPRRQSGQKRTHAETMSPPQLPPEAKCAKKKKNKTAEPPSGPSQVKGGPGGPEKRRPGRPLSTSATARALVKELAELHISRERDQNIGGRTANSAFHPTLPAFPEVSAYVDGVYDDSEARRSSQDNGGKQEDIRGKSASATDSKGGRANKVAAKKHREMIKDRMKNLEDLNAWLDKAVVEYERCNRRLLETVGRFRMENEALLLSSPSSSRRNEEKTA